MGGRLVALSRTIYPEGWITYPSMVSLKRVEKTLTQLSLSAVLAV